MDKACGRSDGQERATVTSVPAENSKKVRQRVPVFLPLSTNNPSDHLQVKNQGPALHVVRSSCRGIP